MTTIMVCDGVVHIIVVDSHNILKLLGRMSSYNNSRKIAHYLTALLECLDEMRDVA